MNRINTSTAKRVLICFCLTAIALYPLIPDGNAVIPRIPPPVQNMLHVPVFAILSMLLFLVFCEFQIDRLRSILLVILISQTVSILTESIQLFIPGRCPSFGDMGYNFIRNLAVIAANHHPAGFLVRRCQQPGYSFVFKPLFHGIGSKIQGSGIILTVVVK